jgi:C-terminal processing protease CtpA/Prc
VFIGYNAATRPLSAVVEKIDRLTSARRTRRVIIDVRLNGGGDNTSYGELTSIFRSKAVNRRGRLYLLTGRATFSAAANFAAEIDRDTRAIIVGEPTGGGVETYGDVNAVRLETTGWQVYVAARYHERKRGPNDKRLAIDPNVRVEVTSAQYFAGRDPVLERALRGL